MAEQASDPKTIGISNQGKLMRDKKITGIQMIQPDHHKDDEEHTEDEDQAITDRGDSESNLNRKHETEKNNLIRTSNPKVMLSTVEQKRNDYNPNPPKPLQEWNSGDVQTLRKSGTSIKDEDHFKLPVTSTVISNVRGKSILNTKNERRDFVEHENPYRASHKDSANQVKISNTLKIKKNNGEVETVEMQNLKIKAKKSQSPLKVNQGGQTVQDLQQELPLPNERSLNVNQQQLFFGISGDYKKLNSKTTMPKNFVHQMYDSVISRAVKMQNAAVQVDVKITKRQSSMDERSKALTTSSSIKDIDSLPHLIPQRTNVLTGASTSYYVNKPAIWNTEYLKLVNYQRKKEAGVYGDTRDSDEKLPSVNKRTQSQADINSSTRAQKQEKVHLPLRGHNLYIGDRIRDFWMRSEIMKAQNIQQSVLNQIQLEEDAREEIQLTHNFVMLQEMLFDSNASPRQSFGQPTIGTRAGETSGFRQGGQTQLLNDRTPKEPLITKAYDAFRKSHKDKQSDLLPTDEYIEEMVKRQFEDKNIRSVQTSKQTLAMPSTKLLRAKDKSSSFFRSAQQVLRTDKEQQQVNIKTVTLNNQDSMAERNMLRGIVSDRSMKYRQAAIVDMNNETRIPKQNAIKKNKNDFYRFLLQANQDGSEHHKINNDVFIPRSILKKNNAPGLIKDQRLEEAAEEFFEYQLAMQQLQQTDQEEQYLGKYEVVFGQHINNTNPLLSPKFKQLIDEYSQITKMHDVVPTDDQSHDQLLHQQPQYSHSHVPSSDTVTGHQSPFKNKIPTIGGTTGDVTSGHTNPTPGGFDKGQIKQEDQRVLMQDMTIESQDDSIKPSTANLSMSGVTHTKKVKVRHAYQDKGVFKTGVEVVEHEIEVDEDDEGKIMALRLYRDGKLTTSQIRDILLRQLKQEKIFGYGSYEEFFNDYFRKQLVAVEDLNRIQQIKDARQRYERRWNAPNKGYNQNMMQGQQMQRRNRNLGGGGNLQKFRQLQPESMPQHDNRDLGLDHDSQNLDSYFKDQFEQHDAQVQIQKSSIRDPSNITRLEDDATIKGQNRSPTNATTFLQTPTELLQI